MDNTEIIQVKLDAVNIGWGIKVKSDFIRHKDGDLVMFDNLNVARGYASALYPNPEDYDIYLIIKDEDDEDSFSDIHFDYIMKINDHYEFYSNVGKYEIWEENMIKIMRIGYFIFENGDKEKMTDYQEGYNKNRAYFRDLKNMFYSYMKNTKYIEISSIDYSIQNEFVANLSNSTMQIHVCTCNRIVAINKLRKEVNERCLVYSKDVDRFLSMYCYVTCSEAYKPKKQDYDRFEYIINHIAESNGIKFIPLTFKGWIIMDERNRYEK